MSKFYILDGGMGTMLQEAGMKPGERTEIYGMNNPKVLEDIQKRYIESGSNYIFANTFGANAHKLKGTGKSVDEVITENIRTAKNAAAGRVKVGLDIGPIGELMEPLGTLSFDEAYDIFKEMIIAGSKAKADFVVFETMSDLSELRAGVLAAKENSDLPVWTTMSFEKNGRTFTGTSVASFAITMDSLGVDALGINCSLGPEEIYPFMEEIKQWTDRPLIVKPNAGLPDPVSGKYDLDAETFGKQMECFEALGVAYMGGCCGTTPEYIKSLKALNDEAEKNGRKDQKEPEKRTVKNGICSSGKAIELSGIRVIGERINPTGKKRFQQALLENDLNYIMRCAIEQTEAGADILDINVGIPGINEAEMMSKVVKAVQSVCDLPLQIDSSDVSAIEAGLRSAAGKVIVNSVNAEDEKLDAILPLVKKYGACVIGLTMDRSGIPDSWETRVHFAQKITDRCRKIGISKENVIIDCLALTISSMQKQAVQTLKAIRYVSEEMGLHCTLGVSNISFGLPERNNITAAFLSQAISAGLDLPIINPNISAMMDVIASCRALMCQDKDCEKYIERFAPEALNEPADKENNNASGKERTGISEKTENKKEPAKTNAKQQMTLERAVVKGLGSEVEKIVTDLLGEMSEMDIINDKLIPALDVVGIAYEQGRMFLPQLIIAANAASCGFEVIKKKIAMTGEGSAQKGTIILATVEGDIHDIGKNIVKVVLENYGFKIIDLGKDVPPEKVVEEAIKNNVRLIGLSALMTTTVDAMKRTIEALKASGHECSTFVGGAVLTAEYAAQIGADFYTKDAKASADVAKAFFA